MKRMYYFLMVLLTVSFMACEEDDGLPEPTQTGAMIMAAKINGKLWETNGSWSAMGGSGLRVQYSDGYFSIVGSGDKREIDASVIFQLTNVLAPGVYILKEKLPGIFSEAGSYGNVHYYTVENNVKNHETTVSSTGTVTITKLDIQRKIISGTFSFKAQNKNNPSEYVEVTDGRFDVKYD